MSEPTFSGNSVTDGAKNLLGHKYGGLPFGVWLLIIGGTVYGVKRYMTKQSAATTVATPGASSNDTTSPGTNTGLPGGSVDSSQPGGDTSNPAPNPKPELSDNQQWQQAALDALVQLGFPAYTAGLALATYLSGGHLAPDQQAMITAAIKAVGAPPTSAPLPLPSGGGAVTTKPGELASSLQLVPSNVTGASKPTLYVYWTDKSGKNLSGMVELQEHIGSSWYDIGTVTEANGVGHRQILLQKGKSRTFRAQVPLNNTHYSQATSPAVTLKG